MQHKRRTVRARHRRRFRAAPGAVLLLVLVLLSGCVGLPTTGPTGPTGTTAPAATASATPIANLDQRIDTYIAKLTPAQRIGQTLMLAVYASGYNDDLNQALTQWHLGSAIIFPNYNGGPLMPTTLAGMQRLVSDLKSHADSPLLLATDEEGGLVDRLSFYYGPTPSPQQLSATGDPHQAYLQAQTDAQRMRQVGLNVDFAPLADINQGGGIDPSRMFGASASQVTMYAGAFLDGLQQNGVAGTLKHWPGLGASTGNPDFTLPTVDHSKDQLNNTDFASFRQLLPHHPDMIMVTHVIVPAYDSQNPASLSPVLVQQVLRDQMGFQGVVVTDAMDAQGIVAYMQQQGYNNPAQGIAEACVRAFLAGDDLIEAPIEQDRLAAVVAAMTQAVQSGRISQARLDTALRRIIRLKAQLGILTLP